MGTDKDAGDVLEYLYLNQETPVDASDIFDASDLSRDDVQAALDELEERMLIDIGLKPDEGGYEDVSLTTEGVDTIETKGSFLDVFDVPLDLNRIAREWD